MHDACTHNTPAPTFIFFSPSFLPPSQFPLVTNEIEVSVRNPSAINDGTLSFHQQSNTSVLAWGSLGGDGWVRAAAPFCCSDTPSHLRCDSPGRTQPLV